VPLYADVSVLFWNKALFEAAGLDPETPPTNLQELHDMAAAITELGDGNYGYYLPGNCAGCNIFTFGPLLWASGVTIEPRECGDEPLTGENLPVVLEWARQMHKDGLIDPAAQAETGATFAEVFGSGKVGIMGTGNFNVVLAKQQNPDIDLGVTLLPGLESGDVSSFAGGDIVTVPKGSDRVEDAVEFMKYILSDEVQVEQYAKLGNMTTRADMADNEYANVDEDVAATAQAIPVSQTPFTLKFFELINSPQGPFLQMLQRVYYTDDPIDQIIADAKQQMNDIICAE
jgi:multiple sugar transport system substrate-binding protein